MKRLTTLASAMMIIAILTGTASAAEIIVDLNGGYDHTTIGAAITAAGNGDTIIVRPGRYYENINMLGKAITLRSTDPDDHEVVTKTIIDGNQADCVITCDSNENPNTVITGFIITNGNAKFIYGRPSTGGGMHNSHSSPTVTNCTFSNNSTSTAYSGGGMCNSYSSPTVSNCTFIGNTAGGGGGMCNSYSSPTVSNCTFIGNTAGGGGGMYNQSSPTIVSNCTFSGNTASSSGGGGMANQSSSVTVSSCIFSGNKGTNMGAGMRNSSSSAEISNCKFIGNVGLKSTYEGYEGCCGGGMANQSSSVTVSNCIFSGNSCGDGFEPQNQGDSSSRGGSGGGMYNVGSSPTVSDCTFIQNRTGNGVGNSFWPDTGGNGGGMCNLVSSPVLTNCLFSENFTGNGSNAREGDPLFNGGDGSDGGRGGSGGGIYTDGENNRPSYPTLINCIFSGNYTGKGGLGGAGVDGGNDGNDGSDGDGGGMYNDDHSFLTLTNASFCYNLPNPVAGAALHADSYGNSIEFCSPPRMLKREVEGDLTGDGKVDMADLAKLATNWMVGTE